MKNLNRLILIFLLVSGSINEISAEGNPDESSIMNRIGKTLSSSPIRFRKNMGQWKDTSVLFLGSTPTSGICFQKEKLSFNYVRGIEKSGGKQSIDDEEASEMFVWNLCFMGMNSSSTVTSEENYNSKYNYLIGNDFNRHVRNVVECKLLHYNEIYPHITLDYYGTEDGSLKYDFVLKPGSNVNHIRMGAAGIRNLSINRKGELQINTSWGTLIEKAPYSYQLWNGVKKEVSVCYKLLNDTTFGFEIRGSYDKSRELIIDPIIMEWNTYVGAAAARGDGYGLDLAVDDEGCTYVAGWYTDKWITTPGVYNTAHNGGYADIIVYKLSADAKTLLYGTFIGGAGSDIGLGIAIDKQGNAYVAGHTSPPNKISTPGATNVFPTTNGAFSTVYNGGIQTGYNSHGVGGDVVVFKLDAQGQNLLYSTFVGGAGHEEPGRGAIAVNDQGEVFVNGFTSSLNFPVTPGAFNTSYNGGASDGFVFKLSADGSTLKYCTYYGGSYRENVAGNAPEVPANLTNTVTVTLYYYYGAGGLVINKKGEAFVTGWTQSNNFPTTNGTTFKGPLDPGSLPENAHTDAFVFRLKDDGSGMIYSTLLGGKTVKQVTIGGDDAGVDLAVDSLDNAYVVGVTECPDFPATVGDKLNSSYSIMDGEDGFVTKLNPAGNIVYSTFIGRNQPVDMACGIALNKSGEAFVVGIVGERGGESIPMFPYTSCGNQPWGVNSQLWGSKIDLFIVKLAANGNPLYATTFGGDHLDYQPKIVLSERIPCMEEITICYGSHSISTLNGNTINGLPMNSGVYHTACGQCGGSVDNSTVARFRPELDLNFTYTTPQCKTPVKFNGTASGQCIWKDAPWVPSTWNWDFGDGTTSTEQNPVHTYHSSGTYKVTLIVGCPADSISKMITILPDANNTVSLGKDTLLCKGEQLVLDAGNQGAVYHWSTGATTQTIQVTGDATIWVEVSTNATACAVTDTIVVKFKDPPVINLRDSSLCEGSPLVLDAGNPGATYSWNTGATTKTITVDSTGWYIVKASFGGGCVDEDTAMITFIPYPRSSLNDTVVCAAPGTTFTLDAGNPGATYLWSTEATTQSMVLAAPGGKYHVVINNKGCKTTDSAEVIFKSGPIPVLRDTGLCMEPSITIDAGNPGSNYWWSTGATTQQLTVTASDTLYVTIDNGICKITDSIKINFISYPKLNLRDSSFCAPPEATVTLDAGNPGSVYLWSNGETTQTTQTVVIKESGRINVSVWNGSCMSSDTCNLEFKPSPVLRLNDTTLCGGNKIVVDAGNSGASFLWSTAATTQQIEIDTAGIYHVLVDWNGCRTTDTMNVQIDNYPVISLNDTVLCTYQPVKITAGVAGSYLWSTNETAPFITINSPGTYWVKAANSQCAVIDSFTVNYFESLSLADVSLCDVPEIHLGKPNRPGNYLWSTGATTSDITVTMAGTYWVEFRGGNCVVYDTVTVTGTFGAPALYIPNTFTPNSDAKNEYFTARGEEVRLFKMEIFNRWGELYFRTDDMNRGWDGTYNGAVVQEDVYVYIIQYETMCDNRKKPIVKLGHVSVIR